MKSVCLPSFIALALLALAAAPRSDRPAAPTNCWQVEDVRPGMQGHGKTVMKGTKVETFQVEIIGVLKNTSPGRDLILARLSGLGLEKTGVIAGMSGSPVYVEGKLLGAVAYAWPFPKDGNTIAGITPFSQMQSFVQALERREVTPDKPVRVSLPRPLRIADTDYDTVTVSQGFDAPVLRSGDGLWLVPLRTPLSATGFTQRSLDLLTRRIGKFGLVPMMGGATTAKIAEEQKDTGLEPGGPLAVALISGDFDLSGIGTVTHIDGNRVYGWGHPFMSLGSCQLPLLSGYIHTVYPRQTVSFKMGSPLREVGVMNADISTCIAGWTDRKADMLPVHMRVSMGNPGEGRARSRRPGHGVTGLQGREKSVSEPRTFKVRVARHRSLVPTLVYTALTNSVDMEGELPEELTAHMRARIELEGHPPVIIEDTFSGFTGGRAPAVLYSQVALVVSQLTYNSFETLRIKSIDCETRIEPGRACAEIDAVELDADTYRPGDTVKATVFVRPYKGTRQRVRLQLKLPPDLPEGDYTALICDEPSSARADLRGNPPLYVPTSADQVIEGLQLLLAAKRTTLTMRLPVGTHGVAAGGKSLPRLPGSMVHILANSKRTGAMTMTRALVAREKTDWVIQGSESVSFRVSKTPRAPQEEE